MSNHLHLFDISAYLHRSMYVTYGDRAATVEATDDAFIRHACTMLARTVEDLRVDRMAVVCDSTEPSFRCDIFPKYKAERKAHYPVFATQMPRFIAALREMDVAVVEQARCEADDLIAAFVMAGQDCVIVSSDKDLMALVNRDARDVRFYDPMKGVWSGASDVREKFGVDPIQLYDYIGLVGDPSDGIPGVAGFGQKTASKLLREFDSLDEIYSVDRREALIEFVSKKQLTTLLASEADAFMSRKLAAPWPCHVDVAGSFASPGPGIIRGACG